MPLISMKCTSNWMLTFARKCCIIIKTPFTQRTDLYRKKLPLDNNTTAMLMWCLKQLKVLILKFSKSIFKLVQIVSFPSGLCEMFYYGYKDDVYFLQYHILAAIHFMNQEGLCQIIWTIFNIYICLNHCW